MEHVEAKSLRGIANISRNSLAPVANRGTWDHGMDDGIATWSWQKGQIPSPETSESSGVGRSMVSFWPQGDLEPRYWNRFSQRAATYWTAGIVPSCKVHREPSVQENLALQNPAYINAHATFFLRGNAHGTLTSNMEYYLWSKISKEYELVGPAKIMRLTWA
jgi:hypothetical protein